MDKKGGIHPRISELAVYLREGKLTRREFLRDAALLGVSAGTASQMVGCTRQERPLSQAPKVTGRDGTLIAYATGLVYDEKTGLEWVAGPDKGTTWYEAKRWVENLKVAGGGWRMPTREELKALYKKGAGSWNMTPLLKTTGWWVWSGETEGSSSAWIFFFNRGFERCFTRDASGDRRGFAVRSRR